LSVSDAERVDDDPNKGLVLSLVSSQRAVLAEATDAIERKASTFLGFEAVLFALILGTATPAADNPIDLILAYTGLGLLLASACLLMLCVNPTSFRFDPNPKGLVQEYWYKNLDETRHSVAKNLVDAWESNRKIHALKVIRLEWALRLVAAGLFVIAFDVLVVRVFEL